MRQTTALWLIISCLLCSCTKQDKNLAGTKSLVELSTWSEANFNGLTDLVYYNNEYYCAFREGDSHASYDGKIRVLRSENGSGWYKFDLISDKKDLRDPHFFIDNNNVLTIGANARDNRNIKSNYVYKLNNNGFVKVDNNKADDDYWLWSFAKSKDNVFSIGYNVKQLCFDDLNSSKQKICLFSSLDPDCIQFSAVSPNNWIPSYFSCPCEASMVFTNDSTIVAIVRDEHGSGKSYIGKSTKPYSAWKWQSIPYFVRGPKLALLPDGRLFLAAASMIDYTKTYYAILNPDDFSIQKIAALVSGGDTGYPGVIIEGDRALISYYSSHEGKAKVYIGRVTY